MKRYLTLSILILAMFLTACGSTGNKSGDNRQVLLTLDSLEEYHAYIEENKEQLPDDFVYWEDISFLGEFDILVIKSNYLYTICDASGSQFILTIDNATKSTADTGSQQIVSSVRISGSNMQKVINNTEKNLIYNRNGLTYLYYRSGELGTIMWQSNSLTFTLSRLSKYPEGRTDTVVGKLLSADDSVANAALAEITQKLATE